MRRILYSLTFITTLLPAVSKAQDATPVSLEEAMNYAVKNNGTAKNARLDVLIQQAKNAEITGLAYPNIKGKGEFMDYINPIQSFVPGEFIGQPGKFVAVPFTPKYSSSASISGSQILFDGSVLVALQARNAVLKLSEQSARLSEEEIRYNVQKAYYSFVIAQRQFNILKNSIAYVRSMANELNSMYKEGFVEKIEIDRTNVSLNNLVTDSVRIGNLISVSEQLLKFNMGMPIETPIVLTDTTVSDKVDEASALLATETSYENRTEFNLLQSQMQLYQYDLKRHKLSGVPSLAAFGTVAYNYATNSFKDIFNEQYIFYSLVGLQLNVPIFDGLQRHNRVKQARLNLEKTVNSIDNLKLGIDFQTSSAKTNLKNTILMMKNQEANLTLATNVLELARKKYQAGVGSNLEVSQAQTEMLQAQGNYFQSMLDVMNAKSDLQKALGDFKQ